jgi:hypothetical protein
MYGFLNKLECSSLAVTFNLVSYLEAAPSENIRLKEKVAVVTNALAYYGAE